MSESLIEPSLANETAREVEFTFALRNALTLFLITFSFWLWNGPRTLGDSDLYWHVVTGEWIWSHRAVPHFDEYSYTLTGAHWIAKEWLSQLIFYGVYAQAGWFGAVFLTAAVAAASYAVMFRWLCRRVSPPVALTLTAVSVSLSMNSLLARPEIFFFPLFTLCVCGLASAVERETAPWWLAPLVVLWANLHASFPIAIVFAAMFALQALASARPIARTRLAVEWALAILVAAVAMGATPYGYEPLAVSLSIVGDRTTSFIDEWGGLAFDAHGAYGMIFIAGVFAILAAARGGWLKAATVAGSAYMMIRHVRFFSVFAIVAPIELAAPIAHRFPRFAASAFSPNALAAKASWAAFGLACVVCTTAITFAPRPVPNSKFAPVAALDAARRSGASGNVYNDYAFGGFLIFNGVKTFIDSRTELYFNGMFAELHDAELSPTDDPFLSMLEKYRVNWAIVVHDGEGALKLRRSKDWNLIYQDEIADVLVRR